MAAVAVFVVRGRAHAEGVASTQVDAPVALIARSEAEVDAGGRGFGGGVELRLFQATGLVVGGSWSQRGARLWARLDLAVVDVDYFQLVPWLEERVDRGGAGRAEGVSLALPLFAPFLPVRLDDTFLTFDLSSRPLFPRALGDLGFAVGIERFVW